MPAVSNIISCPSGQWTSIAQYMETRRALMVQCPEQQPTTTYTLKQIAGGAVGTIAANALRKSLRLGVGSTYSAMIGTSQADVTSDIGIFLVGVPGGGVIQPIVYDVGSEAWASQAWYALSLAPGGQVTNLVVYEEIATCAAIILGIVNTTPTYTGPGGTVPIGIWQTPDLLSGPAEFRLHRDSDADLVIQEWFAWPVGSGNVNVQVFQAFDMPMPETQLTVQIPALSPHGKKAAQDLLAAMTKGKQNGLWTPDDAEF